MKNLKLINYWYYVRNIPYENLADIIYILPTNRTLPQLIL